MDGSGSASVLAGLEKRLRLGWSSWSAAPSLSPAALEAAAQGVDSMDRITKVSSNDLTMIYIEPVVIITPPLALMLSILSDPPPSGLAGPGSESPRRQCRPAAQTAAELR